MRVKQIWQFKGPRKRNQDLKDIHRSRVKPLKVQHEHFRRIQYRVLKRRRMTLALYEWDHTIRLLFAHSVFKRLEKGFMR